MTPVANDLSKVPLRALLHELTVNRFIDSVIIGRKMDLDDKRPIATAWRFPPKTETERVATWKETLSSAFVHPKGFVRVFMDS